MSTEGEVAAFQNEVGGEDEILIRLRPQNRTIVANAFYDSTVLMRGTGQIAYAFDEFCFAHGSIRPRG